MICKKSANMESTDTGSSVWDHLPGVPQSSSLTWGGCCRCRGRMMPRRRRRCLTANPAAPRQVQAAPPLAPAEDGAGMAGTLPAATTTCKWFPEDAGVSQQSTPPGRWRKLPQNPFTSSTPSRAWTPGQHRLEAGATFCEKE